MIRRASQAWTWPVKTMSTWPATRMSSKAAWTGAPSVAMPCAVFELYHGCGEGGAGKGRWSQHSKTWCHYVSQDGMVPLRTWWMVTTTQGVALRSTALRSAMSHERCTEPGARHGCDVVELISGQ